MQACNAMAVRTQWTIKAVGSLHPRLAALGRQRGWKSACVQRLASSKFNGLDMSRPLLYYKIIYEGDTKQKVSKLLLSLIAALDIETTLSFS